MSMSTIKYVIAQGIIRAECKKMTSNQVKEILLFIEEDLNKRSKKEKKDK